MATLVVQGFNAAAAFVASNAGQIALQVASTAAQALLTPTQKSSQEGPRLEETQITTSTEGAPIMRIYGRYRVGGQVIWATRFEEEVVTETTSQGGKGGPKQENTTTTYNYYGNFAIGLCEGVINRVGRIWVDGKEVDLSAYTYRIYTGKEDQQPDPLIQAKEGANNAPAYKGLAYIVFDRMLLTKFGNRIPQFMFEILKPVTDDGVEKLIKGVNLIPGSTEFGYDPDVVVQLGLSASDRAISSSVENAHLVDGGSDWTNSIDQLEESLPELNTVCLVVAWFGDDLRCGECQIKPKVENDQKITKGANLDYDDSATYQWRVAGLDRDSADVITDLDGVPAFGGSPNDASVVRAIQDLKARGHKVMMYPFIMMDVPSDNTLPNPYGGGSQPAFPWRGRITCHPAAGQSGTADKSSAAATQVNAFYGTSTPSNFGTNSDGVTYSGPSSEWSYSRFILHMAKLCDMAGGVDQFCIGSEMVQMTTVRSSSSNYPFVSKLITLAGHIQTMLPSTDVGYAADWSEYHSHRPGDGYGDVYFHLDPLWASANIDFIGIDNYLPLSDWRNGEAHIDLANGASSIYDLDYLKSNVEGGEHYDWFYASQADRDNQVRSSITDGQGKPWVFRNKDIKNWWQNSHVNRPGGTESGGNTAWTPKSKPIVFTEIGCPAIDKGTNQPNVFYDPKTSESAAPHYSDVVRDDQIQRLYLQAMLEYWGDNTKNPASDQYSGRMIDMESVNVWSWDARPWPTFPLDANSWADAANWEYGHWINGRVGSGSVYIPDLMAKLAQEYGFTDYDFTRAYGSCDGYVADRVLSLRGLFEPLQVMFNFELIESGERVKAISRLESSPVATITEQDVLQADAGVDLVKTVRAQEIDLPVAIKMGYIDSRANYKASKVEAKRLTVGSSRVLDTTSPVVIDFARAQQIVDRMLYSAWAGRETSEFGLLPSHLAIEPGDVITLDAGGISANLRVGSATDGIGRSLSAASFDNNALGTVSTGNRDTSVVPDNTSIAPIVIFLDIALLNETDVEYAGYMVGFADPWPGSVAVYRSSTTSNYTLNTTLDIPGKIGETLTTFQSGVIHVWDDLNSLDVELYRGALQSLDDLDVYAGNNAIAVENSQGKWEIVQFADAQLIGPGRYRLSRFLRGRLGTEQHMEDNLPSGARIVFLDAALAQVAMTRSEVASPFNFKYGPAGEPISSNLFTTEAYAFTGEGLRPYAPVHLGLDAQGNDLVLSWIRRTRKGGDNWEIEEVPLAEAFERYRVRVYADATESADVIREVTVFETNSWLYEAQDQATDFGSNQTSLHVGVAQISDSYGAGFETRQEVAL